MGRHHKMGNRREPVENRRENRGEHSAEIKRVVILIVVPRHWHIVLTPGHTCAWLACNVSRRMAVGVEVFMGRGLDAD